MTPSGFRTQTIQSSPEHFPTWLFLPGGPGLGSEAYIDLISKLNLPGTTLLVDYPNDGSNLIDDYDFNNLRRDLVTLIETHNNPVIIAHSFGGMLTLATPQLKDKLAGLIILNSAPSKAWIPEIQKQAQYYNLPDTSQTRLAYLMNPNNERFKKDILACAPYFFTPQTLQSGIELLQTLPYNFKPYAWAQEHFHPYYECLWVPDNLPCLIMGSELDHITPPHLFLDHPRFQIESIQFEIIHQAGHFPWFDNAKQVINKINEFADTLLP